ncbi:photosystem II S4 domain protein [Lyngbya confervoides]|uniref:Photosystem II S4 domain protein n=1 Tax=Lyngbya confervoides BDU141951 TaxID=1574623 RepID=A0ABD4T0Y7_9CYAN|nr:photosystem II S4 domain protein [Lyngbya confervoides]MCM1982093.1 photosystem II S4 domain protein [Lyngbya confervoides BDU141951]
MLPRNDLLQGTEHPKMLTRILDQAEQALKTWEVVQTDFLSPPEVVEVQARLARLTELQGVAWGGYPQAERQRFALARAELPLAPDPVDLTLLAISGNFLFDPATHRDFLGAILGTGIVREKVGDILVMGERGAQAIVIPAIAEFLQQSLTQVRTVPVKTEILPWAELRVREPRTKEITTVEASMRLDAVASAGFGMSRSKMGALIGTGDVRVNWKTVTQASYVVKPGDLVAIRGKGRLTIGEVTLTKKDRYRMQLTRYY